MPRGRRGHGAVSAYRGPERRDRVTPVRPVPAGHLAVGVSAAVAAAGVLVVPLALEHGHLRTAADAVRLFAAVVAVIAGTSLCACWRAEGRAFDAWVGASLTSFGVLLAGVGAFGYDAKGSPGALAVQLLVASGTAGALGYQATVSAAVEADVAPRREISWVVVGGLALVAAIAYADRRALVRGALSRPGAGGAALALVGFAWALCAVSAGARRRWHPADRNWLVAAFGLLAAGPVVWGLLGPASAAGDLVASLLTLAGAATATVAGMEQLVQILRFQNGRSLRLRSDLALVEGELAREQVELGNRLHDLRNAVAAVRSADEALRGELLPPDARARVALAEAVSSELARLQVLIEPDRFPHLEDLDLAEALEGVVAAERSLGTEVLAVLDGARVRSDRHALARAVQNLLVNARRYAPGCPVVLQAAATPGGVTLTVSDTGPGIPDPERKLVFLRGVRGSTAGDTSGDGLGLHLAAELLATCGSRLRLAEQPGPGATFLIELPAAGTPAPAPDPGGTATPAAGSDAPPAPGPGREPAAPARGLDGHRAP